MNPQYQFNLNYTDPLLNQSNDYLRRLDDDINNLKDMRDRLTSQMNNAQNYQDNKKDIWSEIDKEVSSLTNEQKVLLAKDEIYINVEQELQFLIQQELINSVKYKIADTPRGKELLEKHLSNIKNKKETIIAESNKQMELFKKFQSAVQSNPNLTYAEFIKNIKE